MSDIATELILGDCREVMAGMEAESVHAIATDPPYGLAFMGKTWDDFEPKEYQLWCEEWATEALRVLKPGGHMLAFSGSRTFHRLFCGVEDAGFEVRDTILWLYGQGFPKDMDVGKSIDKTQGMDGEREFVGYKRGYSEGRDETNQHEGYVRPWMEEEDAQHRKYARTKPATPEAREWDGWDTQLKPAFEPIVVARKPIEEDTIVEQVLATGTGALNIDACRIDTREETQDRGAKKKVNTYAEIDVDAEEGAYPESLGRHPANVTLDEEAAEMLDGQTGELKSGTMTPEHISNAESNMEDTIYELGHGERVMDKSTYGDSGGPSRFFYTAKAKKSERTVDGRVENPHPTVKPIDLMEWMVELVSAEEQTVLDPFAGTGTTLMAAYNVGRNSIGIEKDPDYMKTARERVEANETYTDAVGTEPDHIYNEALGW